MAKRRVACALALTCLLSIWLTMPAAAAKTITLHDDDWDGIDPYRSERWTGLQALIADPLFVLDPEDPDTLLPNICEAVSFSEDGLTMRLTFSEGMQYASGEPVKPEDFVASIEYGLGYSGWSAGYNNIVEMEVEGNDVICHLSEYRADLPYFLTQPYIALISASQIGSLTPDELRWQAMPYGPFYVTGYEPGVYITLEPNPYYVTNNPLVKNKGPVAVESITIRTEALGDDLIRSTMSEGLLDMYPYVSVAQQEDLRRVSGVSLKEIHTPNIHYLELNRDSRQLADARVREAVLLALDREAIAEACGDTALPAYTMIPQGMQGHDPSEAEWFETNRANDLERARELLAEAGYAEGDDGTLYQLGETLTLTLLTRATADGIAVAQAIEEQLRAIGIVLQVEPLEWGGVYDRVEADAYDLALEALQWGEPILVLNVCLFDTDALEDADAYYALVEQAATTPDAARRVALLSEAQRLLYADCVVAPLYTDGSLHAVRSTLRGLVITDIGQVFFNDL